MAWTIGDNKQIIWTSPKYKEGSLTFIKSESKILGSINTKKLIRIFIKNGVRFEGYSNLDYNQKLIQELLNKKQLLDFEIVKTKEEMIDLFCGNTWPNSIKEFTEKVIIYLTKEKI